VLSKLLTLGSRNEKGQQKLIEMIPIFSSQLLFHYVPIKLKKVLHTNCMHGFIYDTKHGQHNTLKWQHEKGMLNITIGHKINKCMDT
jgi:hypothetical protein